MREGCLCTYNLQGQETGVLLWKMGLKLSSKDLLKEDNSSESGNPQKTG